MGKGFSYTEVLTLLSAQIERLEKKMDSIESRLLNDHGRITELEVERRSNWRWLGWAGGVTIFLIELYQLINK